jgi:hypothetical protein
VVVVVSVTVAVVTVVQSPVAMYVSNPLKSVKSICENWKKQRKHEPKKKYTLHQIY